MTRKLIFDVVSNIMPLDKIEEEHKADVLEWIQSGTEIFRISKPDNPPKHLVSYFVLYDEESNKIMLIDHVKAQAWLPTGGHVELNEDPRLTVIREAKEELNIDAKFNTKFNEAPLFITVTETRGHNHHTDVSLWYIISEDSTKPLDFDTNEMNSYKWMTPEEILSLNPQTQTDPHMHRFIKKLRNRGFSATAPTNLN